MAFGDDVPEGVKKMRTRLALLAFAGDAIVAIVFLLFMVEDLGELAYVVAAVLVASGMAFLFMFPRLPYQGPPGSSSDDKIDQK